MNIPTILLILLIVIYFVTLPKIFEKANEKGWKGYVPFYNFITWIKILGRPWWWFLLLLVPGVNFLVLVILNVETAIVFNKRSTKEQWFAGALPWAFFPKLAFQDKEAKFIGARDWTNTKKSFSREWGEAILFAVIAASIIRAFVLEAFTIPTPSMEGSMLVGDYLFVSKLSYGPRLPETPLSIPFVHNVIPKTMANSYVEWFKLPNFRLPGFGSVDRYDAVVFNFPHGDTVLVDPILVSHDYYRWVRSQALYFAKNDLVEYSANEEKYKSMAREHLANGKCDICPQGIRKTDGIRARPTDKKDNYVKRCVGLPGEDLEVIDQQIYINGEAIKNPSELQFNYGVKFKGNMNQALDRITTKYRFMRGDVRLPADLEIFDDKYDIIVYLTKKEFEEIQRSKNVERIEAVKETSNPYRSMHLFPNSLDAKYHGWNGDNYGPVHIPAKGETLSINSDNIDFYIKVIRDYEHNELDIKQDGIYINGVKSDTYTFQQNYYWMMGDNRHGSADSRSWGYVPEDHVVGKAVFTWFSKEQNQADGDNKIRWNRMLRRVSKGFED